MNNYVTGQIIKTIREKKGLTQIELAKQLLVSEKTISKWETGKGLPDISLIEPLAKALGVSLIELFNGKQIVNLNKSSNMLKGKFFVCPICGNVVFSIGEGSYSCCGIELISEQGEIDNNICIEDFDGKLFISINHLMTKADNISFIAYVTNDRVQIVKLYPEQNAETCFEKIGFGRIYYYSKKEGLFYKNI